LSRSNKINTNKVRVQGKVCLWVWRIWRVWCYWEIGNANVNSTLPLH